MAFTYLILNIIFFICVVLLLAVHPQKPQRAWLITLSVLLALTLVFDNLIIWAGVVEYDATKILGLNLGYAPIEDFFYAILAVIIVPILWGRFHPTSKRGIK